MYLKYIINIHNALQQHLKITLRISKTITVSEIYKSNDNSLF